MRIAKILTSLGVMTSLLTFAAVPVMAQTLDLGLSYGAETGLGTKDVRTTISKIINVFLSLLGIIAVVIVLMGGFTWMTAGGDETKVKKATGLIRSGVIGLAIILSAYAIATFVIKQLAAAVNP